MSRNTSGRHCAAINCSKNRNAYRDLSFFRFPKDIERCNKWVVNIRREDLRGKPAEYLNKNCTVCANHFESIMFMNAEARNRLVWDAVPTIFDIANKPKLVGLQKRPLKKRAVQPPTKKRNALEDMQCSEVLQTPDTENSDTNKETEVPQNKDPEPSTTTQDASSEIRNLKKKVAILEKRVKRLTNTTKVRNKQIKRLQKRATTPPLQEVSFEKAKETISKHCSGVIRTFIMSQLNLISKSKFGRRWSPEFKTLVLTCYFQEPKLYRILSKIMALPSMTTIKGWLRKIPKTLVGPRKFQPGIIYEPLIRS